MENVYYNAYTEVYEILSYMPIKYIKKIPKELLNLFEQKRNKNYNYRVNIDKKICEQEMLIETKSILSNLSRDFWSTPEKKEIILQKEKIERDIYQKELREKYNPDNIFKRNNESQSILKDEVSKDEVFSNNTAMIDYKESFITKILNKIKSIFHLN